ncbi:MAG TPA: hypothetical protein VFD80_03965 [Flavobacteriaceae bacterium]|nr:hypothetical protein [Flavobacteriaceae bacterium]
MKTTERPLEFYQALGKLFYAFAAIDRVVRTEEIEILKKLILEEWVALDEKTDEFGSDASFQIKAVFDWLQDIEAKPENCFESFKTYKVANEKHFNPQVNALIFKTADKIAYAFAGKNKAEVMLLAKLKVLLTS